MHVQSQHVAPSHQKGAMCHAECAHRLVGGGAGISGISGGERRRVSIALELSGRPQVLILDEVTSGLDSYTAHRLMVTLHNIAVQHQRIMITSIHQPSQAIFSMLDRLLLLAHGATVYSGPSKGLDAALMRAQLPSPPGMPMADWLLTIVAEPEKMERLVKGAGCAHEGEVKRAAPLGFGTRLGQRNRAPLLYQLGILVCCMCLLLWVYPLNMLVCLACLSRRKL
jgi:ABC-type antimicrobial peptide transport system ATPase subunit